jgi:hypothetical protein
MKSVVFKGTSYLRFLNWQICGSKGKEKEEKEIERKKDEKKEEEEKGHQLRAAQCFFRKFLASDATLSVHNIPPIGSTPQA